MPNLKPWNNQQNSNRNEEKESTTSNKFENYLLSIRDERQEMFILIAIQHIMNVSKKL
jgi:hypothetical protein